jgi:hypothetical protein
MTEYVSHNEMSGWQCGHCHIPLTIKPVQIEYLGSAFPVDLPVCTQCGLVFIPESLALGKMAEVEKSLEDK